LEQTNARGDSQALNHAKAASLWIWSKFAEATLGRHAEILPHGPQANVSIVELNSMTLAQSLHGSISNHRSA
jgi:hypothetical protein